MIKFRPNFRSVSASLKDEMIFDSFEAMIAHVYDSWSRVVSYMEASPFRPEEILIGDRVAYDPRTGWRNVRPITVTRFADAPGAICIGFCGE